jgi:hypothetical protein
MTGHEISKVMSEYVRDTRKQMRRDAVWREGFIDSDYPHSAYDYSTDDHNNCEYQQAIGGGWN